MRTSRQHRGVLRYDIALLTQSLDTKGPQRRSHGRLSVRCDDQARALHNGEFKETSPCSEERKLATKSPARVGWSPRLDVLILQGLPLSSRHKNPDAWREGLRSQPYSSQASGKLCYYPKREHNNTNTNSKSIAREVQGANHTQTPKHTEAQGATSPRLETPQTCMAAAK